MTGDLNVGLIIHVDGGARGNPGPAGAGVRIETEDGQLLYEGAYFLGQQTNNAAEYLAVIHALTRIQQWPIQPVRVYSDSELLVRQVIGEYQVKSPNLLRLYEQVQMFLLMIPNWSFQHVKREENQRADELANLAMDQQRNQVVFDAELVDDPANMASADNQNPTPAPPAGKAPATEQSREDEESLPAVDYAVRITVGVPPEGEFCPAAEGFPLDFVVKTVLPNGLCVYAAHALLPTLLGMLNTKSQEFMSVPTLTVRCGRPGCRAVFHLTPVHSSNGHPRDTADSEK
ncbi:MAG: ribonuclease HI family protein [Planctomycetota bacterium]